ncbi:putative glycerol-3-phosphate dehydrogenase [NAD(+)] 1, cytosolic-like [Capsicum annuum]|uniref:uncharacterized protein LOC107870030 n=1 Tax=Capsicum annuum TaxID=4072 RepID=UPI001FB08588|nr:uncharacterized protein LOC107870030 [Capsicum annuum]KAF3647246.1 putative glycerol-3-phosphate dehydrogenase [NAD(+)] 1, cytosolic-like [Capsicum annuum]
MDLFIWGPSYSQDEYSFPANKLAQNSYFSQTLDIIEEDALNEKCCVQVLEILITKADTEIAELEDDIVMLQSQLDRTDEKWLDKCVAALNEKIDHLSSSITALKNENVQASGVHLQTNRKPSEKIHEILGTPLIKFSSPQDKQPADSTLGSPKLAADVLIKVEATDDYDLKDLETVEMNVGLTVQADVTVQTPSVVQEENHQEINEQEEHTNTKGSCTKALVWAGDESTLKDLNESDIPGKQIDASKQENPSHLKNFACAVLKSARTKPLRDKAQLCGTSKRKINMSDDFSEDGLMQQSSNDVITINSSPEVEETSIGEGPKLAGAILVTSVTAVKQQPEDSGDEQTPNGGKVGQTSEKHTSSQLVSKKQTGAKSFLVIKGEGLLNPENKDGSKQPEKSNGEQQVKQSCRSQVLEISKSNSTLSLKLEGQRLNIKWKMPPKPVKEPCLVKELGFKKPSGRKPKRQLKTESTKENGGDVFGDKTIKESRSLREGAKGTVEPPEISSTSLLPLKKRRTTSFTGPVLQENENLRNFQNRLAKSHNRSNRNLQVVKAENDELLDSTTFIVPTPNIADLEHMTKNQLKAVARQQDLHGVYKLRKAELQERLRSKLLAKGQST